MKKSYSELEAVLKIHAKKYPLMSVTDAVKLIFQNEFGGEHLISSKAKCLEYLTAEYNSVTQTDCEFYEDIGGGIIRVFLPALRANSITPTELCELFISSAEMTHGDINSFLKKLDILKELTESGLFAFSSDQLEEYLTEYASLGYPPVSHSEIYRLNYKPAYRIILKNLLPSHKE